MIRFAKWGGFVIAFALLVLSITNASWLAADPVGAPKLIAHRGLTQDFDRADVGRDTCTATRIEEPFHTYLENTREGILRADKLGAWFVEVDVAPTADGEVVLFHDWMLDCRTDGSGEVRDATLQELRELDIHQNRIRNLSPLRALDLDLLNIQLNGLDINDPTVSGTVDALRAGGVDLGTTTPQFFPVIEVTHDRRRGRDVHRNHR